MRRKLTALLLALAMLASMVPAAGAAKTTGGGPNDFLKTVSLPLMPARSSGLYDDPETELPSMNGEGFILDVEGWTPALVESGVPVKVGEADTAATVITDAEGLQAMTAGNYVLGADIDMTGVVWDPIKVTGSSNHLVLDGQGHTIKGLYIDMTDRDQYGGMIREIDGNLTVKNLRLEDCSMNTAASFASIHGILAGDVKGELQLENIAATGLNILLDCTKVCSVGGLVGAASKSAVLRDISVESSILRSVPLQGTNIEMGHDPRMGGMIGGVGYDVDAQRCYVKTEISNFDANCPTGGMIGGIGGLQRSFKDCMVEADISARNICGGLVGKNTASYSGEKYTRMENCVVLGELDARNYVGGYFGDVYSNDLEFCDCRCIGTITLNEGSTVDGNDVAGAGGLVGRCAYSSITAERCAADMTWIAACANAADPGVSAGVGGVLGYGDAGCDLYITGCNYKLTVDEQLTDEMHIGGINGTNFGYSGYASVRDTFADVDITLKHDGGATVAGMIARNGSAQFVNCGAKVNVELTAMNESQQAAGGLCWDTDTYATMAKCYADGTIKLNTTGKVYAAGLGEVGQVSQCYSGVSITVDAEEAEVSGLVNTNKGRPLVSSWSDDKMKATTTGTSRVGGLICWNNNASITDCCFTGSITTNNGGDLGGIAARGAGTYRNCYALTNLANGNYIGGIVGGDYIAGTTNLYDCRFVGSIRNAKNYAAGILTYGNGGTIARCKVDADIDCPDISVGGIISGDYGMSTVRGCTVDGSIQGMRVGGIAGDCYYLSIYDCVVTAEVDLSVTDEGSGNRGAGGIAYCGYIVDNCHMKQPMEIWEEHTVFVGGVIATCIYPYPGTAIVRNCSSKGVTCYGPSGTSVGGIGGDDSFIFSNCRVDGDVRVYVDGTSGQAGGICGGTSKQIYDCVMNGDVVIHVSCPKDSVGGQICAGGIAGGMYSDPDSILSRSYHVGSVHASYGGAPKQAPTIYTEHPLVGRGGNVTDSSFDFDGARDEETYVINTYWHEEYDTIMQPLAGVSIFVDGKEVGTTNKSGTLTLKSKELADNDRLVVSAEKDGYRGAQKEAWFADDGVLNLYLMKKTPGKIYLKAARIYDNEDKATELLYTNNNVTILQSDMSSNRMYFEVDWNDLEEEEREVQLTNEDGSRLVIVNTGDNYLKLNEIFKPSDKIWVKATAYDADGNLKESKDELGLKIAPFTTPSFNGDTKEIPLGDNGDIRGIDFLSGLDIGVKGSFNDCIVDVSFVNNALKVKFGDALETPKLNFLNTQVKLSVIGEGTAAVGAEAESLKDAIWSGGLTVEFGLDPALDYSMSAPPLAFSTEIKATVNGNLELAGKLDNPKVTGTYGGGVDFDIVAGLGAGISDWRVIAGPNVGATGSYKAGLYVHDATAEDIDEVTIEGDASFAIEVKAGEFFEFQPGYQIGRFKWTNKDGMRVYGLGVELGHDPSFGTTDKEDGNFSEGDGSGSGGAGGGGRAVLWMPAVRQYLAEGGGFVGVEAMPALAALNGWTAANSAENQMLYENIALASCADLTMENGVPVMYFTADDESTGTDGTVADHTALWRSAQDENGVWGAPEQVETSGYVDNLDADGPFAVWIESDQTEDLAGLMTSTDVMVSVNGVTTQLTKGEGYVYGAQVSASADGRTAQVIWFSDPNVDGVENLTAEHATLHYAQYNGSSWSAVRTVNTNGKQVVAATPCQSEDHIYWMDENGTLYICKLYYYGRNEEKLINLAMTAHDGEYTAAVTADGLCVWQDTSLKAVLNASPVELEMVHSDDNYCVVWSQSNGIYYADAADEWKVKPLVKTEQMPQNLSAVMVNHLPVVSYYLSDYNADQTRLIQHLYTAKAADLSGVDLEVTGLELDEADVARSGLLRLSAAVTNLRTDEVTGYTYVVTDEQGESVYSGEVSDLVLGYGESDTCFALFMADPAAKHTYTLTVTAENDTNAANNAASVGTQSAAEVVTTGFPVMPSGAVGLEAIVGNTGTAPVEKMTVEIFRSKADGTTVGEALVSKTFENVPVGSYRQVILDQAGSHQMYQVVLTSNGEKVDRELLMWKDEEAAGLWVGGVSVEGNEATVKLTAQNWTKDVQLHLAFYQDGRMVANAMESVEAWDGGRSVSAALSDELPAGEYTCSVFVLEENGLIPVVGKYSERLNIE